MAKFLLRLVFVLLLASLVGCNGGGGGVIGTAPGSGAGPTTAQVQGTWTGTLTITGQAGSAIQAVIIQGGPAFFFDRTGVLYVLPQFTGSTSFSGDLLAIAPPGTTFASGRSQEGFPVTITVTNANSGTGAKASIEGSFSGNGETGSFTLTPATPFAGNPSIVAGNWQGFYLGTGSAAVALTVQPGGSFAGNDSNGCALEGSLSQLQSDQDVFAVTLTSAGSASTCLGNLQGVAYESTTDISGLFGGTVGTYYYISVSGPSGGFTAEVKVQ